MNFVVNIKNKEKYDVYIGRPSKWGNPFVVGKHGVRGECVELHKNWLLYGEGQYLLKDLHELKGKILGCYCRPSKCHGDILSELANQGLKN